MPGETLAFGTEGQPVDVAADPAAHVPGQGAACIGVLPLQLIDEEQVVDAALVHVVRGQYGEGGGAVGSGDRRQRRTRVAGGTVPAVPASRGCRMRPVLHVLLMLMLLVLVHLLLVLLLPVHLHHLLVIHRRHAVPGMAGMVVRAGGLGAGEQAQVQAQGEGVPRAIQPRESAAAHAGGGRVECELQLLQG